MPVGPQIAGAARQAALGSLGEIVRSPIARATLKYWWVTVPIVYAAWRSWQKRKKQGEANPIDILMDVSPLVAAIGTLVVINASLANSEARKAAPAAASPTAGARDAEFSLRRPAATAVPATSEG